MTIRVRRPRMRQAFSYKIAGECGFLFTQPETFDTVIQAEQHAAKAVKAFEKLGKNLTEIMIDARLVPAKHITQVPGISLVVNNINDRVVLG